MNNSMEYQGMFYLVEQDIMTGEWSTNFTMYDTNIDDLMKRVSGDRIYIREFEKQSHTGIMYRIIHPRDERLDKFVCIIQSIV